MRSYSDFVLALTETDAEVLPESCITKGIE